MEDTAKESSHSSTNEEKQNKEAWPEIASKNPETGISDHGQESTG